LLPNFINKHNIQKFNQTENRPPESNTLGLVSILHQTKQTHLVQQDLYPTGAITNTVTDPQRLKKKKLY
jgi:hypothetical protein